MCGRGQGLTACGIVSLLHGQHVKGWAELAGGRPVGCTPRCFTRGCSCPRVLCIACVTSQMTYHSKDAGAHHLLACIAAATLAPLHSCPLNRLHTLVHTLYPPRQTTTVLLSANCSKRSCQQSFSTTSTAVRSRCPHPLLTHLRTQTHALLVPTFTVYRKFSPVPSTTSVVASL